VNPITDRVLLTLPESAYRARPELNFSRLKLMAQSPRAFRESVPTSSAFALGRAAHVAILEPDALTERFVALAPEFSQRRGKAYEEWASADGREVLLGHEYQTAELCAASSMSSRRVRGHLDGSNTELSIVTSIRDIPVKARLDWYGPGISAGDLKTVASMDLGAFFRQCINLHYLAQFAFYSDVLEAATGERSPWKAIIVEKRAPHDIAVVSFSEEDLAYGRSVYDGWLDRYIECMSRDVWPGVTGEDDAEIPYVMPAWVDGDADDAEGGFEGVEVENG